MCRPFFRIRYTHGMRETFSTSRTTQFNVSHWFGFFKGVEALVSQESGVDPVEYDSRIKKADAFHTRSEVRKTLKSVHLSMWFMQEEEIDTWMQSRKERERIHSSRSDACYECLKINACKMWRPNVVLVLTLRNDCFKQVPVLYPVSGIKCMCIYVTDVMFAHELHKFIRCHPEFVSPVMHTVHNVPYVLDVWLPVSFYLQSSNSIV